jgi:putative exporter of polyketide antibiotics
MIAGFILKWIGIIGIIVTVIGIIMFLLSLKNTEHDGRWKYVLAIGISLIIISVSSLIGKIIGISVLGFLFSLKSTEHNDNRKEKI